MIIASIIVYALIAVAFAYLNYYIVEGSPELVRIFAVFVAAAMWPGIGWLTLYCWWKYGLNK